MRGQAGGPETNSSHPPVEEVCAKMLVEKTTNNVSKSFLNILNSGSVEQL